MASKKALTPEQLTRRVRGFDQVKRPALDFPPVTPGHSALEPVFAGCGNDPGVNMWIVRGTFPMLPPLLTLPLTMCIYRDASGALTLINAFRVSPVLEDEMLSLGRVAHVVKLGQFHGAGDAYYACCGKFGAPRVWLLPGASYAEGLPAAQMETLSCGALPVPGARLYVCAGFPYPEAVLVLPDAAHGDTLVATDALANVEARDADAAPLLSRTLLRWFFVGEPGVPRPPPVWLKNALALCGGEMVRGWFDEMLSMEFRHFVPSHGSPVIDVCKGKVAQWIRKTVS